jgi:8-oxo-dGTP pyrophosphatase MutT (NUDIX family)
MAHAAPLLDPRLLRLRALLDPVPDRARDPYAPAGWEEGTPTEASSGTPRAAVALVLREAVELEILLIKRAISERDPWSGHMAFPGGRFSRDDASLLFTAVRETAEETGLALDPGERLLGALSPVSPVTRRLPPLVISPFVFAVEGGAAVVPDPREVESALWVPLRHLADPGNRAVVDIPLPEGPIPFPAFRVGEHVVWGLTYRILDHFLRRTRD